MSLKPQAIPGRETWARDVCVNPRGVLGRSGCLRSGNLGPFSEPTSSDYWHVFETRVHCLQTSEASSWLPACTHTLHLFPDHLSIRLMASWCAHGHFPLCFAPLPTRPAVPSSPVQKQQLRPQFSPAPDGLLNCSRFSTNIRAGTPRPPDSLHTTRSPPTAPPLPTRPF